MPPSGKSARLVRDVYALLLKLGFTTSEANAALDTLLADAEQSLQRGTDRGVVFSKNVAISLAKKKLGQNAPISDVNTLADHYYTIIIGLFSGVATAAVLETLSRVVSQITKVDHQLQDSSLDLLSGAATTDGSPDKEVDVLATRIVTLPINSREMIDVVLRLLATHSASRFFDVKFQHYNYAQISMATLDSVPSSLSSLFDGSVTGWPIKAWIELEDGVQSAAMLAVSFRISATIGTEIPSGYYAMNGMVANAIRNLDSPDIKFVWPERMRSKSTDDIVIAEIRQHGGKDFQIKELSSLRVSRRVLRILAMQNVKIEGVIP